MIGPEALATLDTDSAPAQTNECGAHLSRGIPIERCGHQSGVGASNKGKEVLGGVGGFQLGSLLGETTPSRLHHRQRSRQLGTAFGTHLPGHKGP